MEFWRKHAECFPPSAVAPEAAQARRSLMEDKSRASSIFLLNHHPSYDRHNQPPANYHLPSSKPLHVNTKNHENLPAPSTVASSSNHHQRPFSNPPSTPDAFKLATKTTLPLHHPLTTSHHSPLPLTSLSLTNLASALPTPRFSHLTLKLPYSPIAGRKPTHNIPTPNPIFNPPPSPPLQPASMRTRATTIQPMTNKMARR